MGNSMLCPAGLGTRPGNDDRPPRSTSRASHVSCSYPTSLCGGQEPRLSRLVRGAWLVVLQRGLAQKPAP